MIDQLAIELRAARRKSGLSQEDCAHFLDVHPSKISLLESGRALPSVTQTYMLSMIYGRTLESFFAGHFREVRKELRLRLQNAPEAPKRWAGNFSRDNTFRALSHRLSSVTNEEYGD